MEEEDLGSDLLDLDCSIINNTALICTFKDCKEINSFKIHWLRQSKAPSYTTFKCSPLEKMSKKVTLYKNTISLELHYLHRKIAYLKGVLNSGPLLKVLLCIYSMLPIWKEKKK